MGFGSGGPEPIIPISSKDVEIEKLSAGNIIHIFTDNDPHDQVETIVKALYFMEYAKGFEKEVDDLMKAKELPEYLIMALTETKRLIKKSLQDAERNSFDFLAKLEV